jgi:DNA repair exonuclease SbcCD ATPase subunit
LEKEVAELSRLASELRPMVERLQVRRDEDAAARAELAASQSVLDRRMVEVGRAELTLQTRLDELDQLESELRSELEARERELERQRATLAEELRASRRPSIDAPTPPPASWSILDRGSHRAGPTQTDIQLSPPDDSQTS